MIGAWGALLAGIAVWLPIALLANGAPASRAVPTVAVLDPLLFAMVVIFWRFVRSRVVATDRGLVVRNVRSTRRFDWSEVAGVSVGRDLRGPVMAVTLRSGETVKASAVATALRTEAQSRWLTEVVDSLEAMRVENGTV